MLVNKIICIIGGTGSLGEELIKKYDINNNIIHIISRDELKQWLMKRKYTNVNFHIGDIRNIDSMRILLKIINPQVIINCAALKHIDVCEYNISECLSTNVNGIKNIIEICMLNSLNVETVVFVSTDKACSPINVYGMSKSISERLMVEASIKNKNIKFVCVRYGNVINSRGSILPKFKELAENKEETFFPVTSDKMTRFFMKIEESVDLVDNAIQFGESGDTWIPRIDSFKIIDLANYFAKKYNKEVKIIGLRPGEKYDECLINCDEISRTNIFNNFYVIKPCYFNYNFNLINEEYTSKDTINFEKLEKIIETFL